MISRDYPWQAQAREIRVSNPLLCDSWMFPSPSKALSMEVYESESTIRPTLFLCICGVWGTAHVESGDDVHVRTVEARPARQYLDI
jgi:hypothetical protein